MMPKKRVFLVHGWGGNPDNAWFPWLKKELESRGFSVIAPEMPDTENPKIETWVPHLAKAVGEPDEQTYLVGHSVGCQTILRYLETLPEGKEVGGVLFVAGWVTLINLDDEEKAIAEEWLVTPIDWNKARRRAERFIAIHSDNDHYVSLDDANFFKEKLGAEVVIEHNKGHFNEQAGVTELPSALKAILKIAK